MKHTPGEWWIVNYEAEKDASIIRIVAHGCTICDVNLHGGFFDKKSNPEPFANARLIAKAPEMLEVLKETLELTPNLGYRWYDKINALIAQIEGGE